MIPAVPAGLLVLAAEALAIVGARVQPAPDAAPIMSGTIVVVDGRIAQVGPAEEVSVPPGATTIDGKGLIAVAGFQNSHVHFTEDHWANAAEKDAATLREQLERMLTRWGFTTVVDTGSLLENTLALRRRIEAGEVPGPRILTAGTPLYPPRGVPYYVKETLPPSILPLLPQPETAAAAREVVARQLERGADIVKIFSGSWAERGKVLPMPEEIASAAVAEAHAKGRLTYSHPSNIVGMRVAVQAGVDVLAHAVEDTRGLTDEDRKMLLSRNVAIVPTLGLFRPSPFLWEIGDVVRDHARAGGSILFGTDVGYLTDYDPVPDYRAMAAMGMSWREILESLTTAPAARFREAERRGRIAPGMEGDLVLLGSDPAAGVEAFADVRHAIRGGRVIWSSKSTP